MASIFRIYYLRIHCQISESIPRGLHFIFSCPGKKCSPLFIEMRIQERRIGPKAGTRENISSAVCRKKAEFFALHGAQDRLWKIRARSVYREVHTDNNSLRCAHYGTHSVPVEEKPVNMSGLLPLLVISTHPTPRDSIRSLSATLWTEPRARVQHIPDPRTIAVPDTNLSYNVSPSRSASSSFPSLSCPFSNRSGGRSVSLHLHLGL